MRVINNNKRIRPVDFGSLDAGDVFMFEGFSQMKVAFAVKDTIYSHVEYNFICLSTGALGWHDPHVPVYPQPEATTYLKG